MKFLRSGLDNSLSSPGPSMCLVHHIQQVHFIQGLREGDLHRNILISYDQFTNLLRGCEALYNKLWRRYCEWVKESRVWSGKETCVQTHVEDGSPGPENESPRCYNRGASSRREKWQPGRSMRKDQECVKRQLSRWVLLVLPEAPHGGSRPSLTSAGTKYICGT